MNAALDHSRSEGGTPLAERFVDAVERGLHHIGTLPLSGSLRYSYELDIPELRAWPLSMFPYIIFYLDHHDHVDVWRVLHARRDVPSFLAQPGVPDPS